MQAQSKRGRTGLRGLGEGLATFMHQEAAGAVVLAVATLAALVIANTPMHEAFQRFWETEAGFHVGGLAFDQTLRHWVDDGLMAVFFFVVGLEIKREFIAGELSNAKSASLPVIAAVGGMLVPALIFLAFNAGSPDAAGWGVPMATDIAFALGAVALLGSRVPSGLKAFLVALAIADDLGAILVIALFYTAHISIGWLLFALVPVFALFVMNRSGITEPLAYLAAATVLWFAVLNSGVHATIAGVVAAVLVPAVAPLTPLEFTDRCRLALDEIEAADVPGSHVLEDDTQQKIALSLRRDAEKSAAPLQRLEFALHPFTTFVVLPLFALANAGVSFSGGFDIGSPLVLGVLLGLIVGKPVGITVASWLAVRTGLGILPQGVRWSQIVGIGALAGIGFTMSLFVANLAFGAGHNTAEVTMAVLLASILAGVIGTVWLRVAASEPSAA